MRCHKHKNQKFYFKKSREIFIDIYEYKLRFVETNDFDKAAEKLKIRTSKDYSGALALTWTSRDESKGFIFCYKNPPVHYLAHECWHVLYEIFTNRGMEFEEETVAYHLDYLVKKAAQFYYGT